ncbi:hypothetical protein G7068_08235 [Leucobacter viscericola]|uniref:Oxygen-dependent protoporphyrinogen oxidase n=1 Tax=Leucobacter viscericola TaxID=2714935 RepID=A0A6G7XF13_9MICO|nr:hypothetical protein [Leucobacter viscericola]QIK63184.1 hypothetical protein G7068_08235 [Leucobacter viscericola]
MIDAYVIGTTLPALAAALELAEVGLSVRVSVDVPAPALTELDRGGELDPESTLAEFLEHLAQPIGEHGTGNPGAEPVRRDPRPVQLRGTKGDWTLQPTPSVWGIPSVPMAAQSLAILGGGAATRASLDRVKPVLTIGKTHELGALVRNRMGKGVETLLVDPLVRERYGVAPDAVDVALVAPGLNEALTRAGSLSGAALAYSERYVARETRVAPAGGWPELQAILVERLKLYGVEFSELPVQEVRADETQQDTWLVSEFGDEQFATRAVVLDPATHLPAAFEADLLPLAPEVWRAQARVRVESPEALDEDHPALRTVEVAGQDPWSLRLDRDANSQWFALLRGPRFVAEGWAQDRGADLAEAARIAGQVLEVAGLRATSECEVTVAVAPYISTARRDAESDRLIEQRDRDHTLLPVGVSFHGGELSSAVADARDAAIALRRRLTGIAE